MSHHITSLLFIVPTKETCLAAASENNQHVNISNMYNKHKSWGKKTTHKTNGKTQMWRQDIVDFSTLNMYDPNKDKKSEIKVKL